MKLNFKKPNIMGILNITPDSFSDGGEFVRTKDYELRIQQMIDLEVEIIDVGGESTGPGSENVSVDDELTRVKPVIDYILENKLTDKALFSIDTYKYEVAEYALENGFGMVNDVTALRGDDRMIDLLIRYQPYVILMYSKDETARTTTDSVEYEDVIETVSSFLLRRAHLLLDAGFPKEKIILDPGMGAFVSSNPDYSFEILDRLPELLDLEYPLLIGVSRKSFLGGPIEERDSDSIRYSKKALQNGVSIVRVHNVKMMRA